MLFRSGTAIVVAMLNLSAQATAWEPGSTGNHFLPPCEAAGQELSSITLGGSYLVGIFMGTLIGLRHSVNSATNTCVPHKVTGGQLVSVVVRYLRNHPERLHEPFLGLAVDARHDAWPCKRG